MCRSFLNLTRQNRVREPFFRLAGLGYSVANINYRHLSTGHGLPHQSVDILTAMRFLESNYDAKRFITFGHSAGAQLSMLVALLQSDGQRADILGQYPKSPIVAAIGIAGPYDYGLMRGPGARRFVDEVCHGDSLRYNVVSYADGQDLPVLLLAGADDDLVTSAPTVDVVDYWDATPLLEGFPLLGRIVRMIKRMMG